MGLDTRIPLSVKTLDIGQAADSFYDSQAQADQYKTNALLRDRTEQQMTHAADKASREDQMFQLQDMAMDAVVVDELLKAGDYNGTMQYLSEREKKIRLRDGDPSHTRSVMERLAAGDLEGVQQELAAPINAWKRINGQEGQLALSSYGKDAVAMGFKPGTPAFNAQVEKLRKVSSNQVNVDVNNAANKGLTKEQEALADVRVSNFKELKDRALEAEDQNMTLEQIKAIDVNQGFGEEGKASAAAVFNAFGVNGDSLLGVDSANVQAFNSQTQKLLAEVLATQKGPQTDKDADRMLGILPKVTNQGLANQFIMSSMQALNNRKIEQAQFYERVLEEEGTLKTADKRWRDYKNKTPMVSDVVKNTQTGLPMFFDEFLKNAQKNNPQATRQQLIQAWRKLND